jgi:hypothetical protein
LCAGVKAPQLLVCVLTCALLCVQEPAANIQLYSLCDMASSTVEGLAAAMQLQLSQLPQYAGGIILPRGLYRALDKADRGEQQAMLSTAGGVCPCLHAARWETSTCELKVLCLHVADAAIRCIVRCCAAVGGDLSYLPLGYEFVPDPQPAAALAAPMNAAPVAATGRGRSRTAAPAGGGGRGSKRKAAAAATEKNARQAADQEGEEGGEAAPQPKRARGAGGRPRSKGRGKAAPADSDDGWHSADDGELLA